MTVPRYCLPVMKIYRRTRTMLPLRPKFLLNESAYCGTAIAVPYMRLYKYLLAAVCLKGILASGGEGRAILESPLQLAANERENILHYALCILHSKIRTPSASPEIPPRWRPGGGPAPRGSGSPPPGASSHSRGCRPGRGWGPPRPDGSGRSGPWA